MEQKPAGDGPWVAIALVVGPRGNRGEIETVLLGGKPGRPAQRGEVYLFEAGRPEAQHRRFEVETAWAHGDRFVWKLRGVDSISDAEKLRGCEVRIPLADRPTLPPGEYYQSDLVGWEVTERSRGRRLGLVRGWQEYGGPALLEVEAEDGKEILIPFAGSICVEIDPPARRIVVELPEGLKDLNR